MPYGGVVRYATAMSPLTLTVDLDALADNYRVLVRAAGGAQVAPVVKADGYGLGANACARRLRAEGAESFYVARLAEGEALRAGLGPEPIIYVLDGARPGTAPRLLTSRLTPVLNSLVQVEAWSAAGGGERLACALHVDTGMNRLGLRPEEALALVGSTDRTRRLDIDLVISHLACADEPDHPLNERQRIAFAAVLAAFPRARASLANSAAVFLGHDYLLHQVRPGIGLYGGAPIAGIEAGLRTVATLEAEILQVRTAHPGETVGYGADYRATHPTKVAILAAGYADGILRSFSPGGYAWFDGARRPLLGRVSMDLIAIDVTGCDAAVPGARVEVLGANITVDEFARISGSSAYEVLTRLCERAERHYIGDPG
jgi:alanine racemase